MSYSPLGAPLSPKVIPIENRGIFSIKPSKMRPTYYNPEQLGDASQSTSSTEFPNSIPQGAVILTSVIADELTGTQKAEFPPNSSALKIDSPFVSADPETPR